VIQSPGRDYRFLLSLLAAGAGLLVGVQVAIETPAAGPGADTAGKVTAACFMGYVGWALFWGAPRSWRWLWRRRTLFSVARQLRGIGWALHLALVFTWMTWGVLVASVFGAGVYQFFRYRRSRLATSP